MRLAILCSGQAGQRREMLDDVFAASGCAALLDTASALLGRDVVAWWRGLDDDAMYANANAQFAIVLLEIGNWLRLQPLLPATAALAVVAGYSLGELAAYYVAGALDARECLRLARVRAEAMDRACAQPGPSMLLLRGSALAPWRDEISRRGCLPSGLHVAIRRCVAGVVVGGTAEAVGELAVRFGDNPDAVLLPVGVPSHTPLLEPAARAFRSALQASALTAPRCSVLAGIDATPVRSREAAVDALSRQICTTVRWDLCMETLRQMRLDAVLEIGPGNDLSRLVSDGDGAVPARAISDFADVAGAANWVGAR